jgi:hypothetical protein
MACAQVDQAWAIAALENARIAADTIKVRRTRGDLLEDLFVSVLCSVATAGLMSAYVASFPVGPGLPSPTQQAMGLQLQVIGSQLAQNPWSALGMAAGQFPAGSAGRAAFQSAAAWHGVTSVDQYLAKDPSLTLHRDLMRMEIVATLSTLDRARAARVAASIEDVRPGAIASCSLAAARAAAGETADSDFATAAAKAREARDPAVRALLLAQVSQARRQSNPAQAEMLRKEAESLLMGLPPETAATTYQALARAVSSDPGAPDPALLLKAGETARLVRDALKRARLLTDVGQALEKSDPTSASGLYEQAVGALGEIPRRPEDLQRYVEVTAVLSRAAPAPAKRLLPALADAIAACDDPPKRLQAALLFARIADLDAPAARKVARALRQHQGDDRSLAAGQDLLAAAAILAPSDGPGSADLIRKGVSQALPSLLELARGRVDLTAPPVAPDQHSRSHTKQLRPFREAEPWWGVLALAGRQLAQSDPASAQQAVRDVLRIIAEADAKQGGKERWLPEGYLQTRAAICLAPAGVAAVQEMTDDPAQPLGLWTPFARIALAGAELATDPLAAGRHYIQGVQSLPRAGVGVGSFRGKQRRSEAVYEILFIDTDPMGPLVAPGLAILDAQGLSESERIEIGTAMREAIKAAPWEPQAKVEALTRLAFSLLGTLEVSSPASLSQHPE